MKKSYKMETHALQANTGDEQMNNVVTSEDYEVGEGSEKVQEIISLQEKERNDGVYDFQSSEDISDADFVVSKHQKIERPLIRYKKSAKTGKLLPCKAKG